MRSLAVFAGICLILLMAYVIGAGRDNAVVAARAEKTATENVPHVGSIQVLNGCGIDGAAGQMADFLRSHRFDVKDIGNAEAWDGSGITWNYPETIVVSQTTDLSNARKVARALSTDKVVLRRIENTVYDVVVFVGPDYAERIK